MYISLLLNRAHKKIDNVFTSYLYACPQACYRSSSLFGACCLVLIGSVLAEMGWEHLTD